jgi:hypothetical protein
VIDLCGRGLADHDAVVVLRELPVVPHMVLLRNNRLNDESAKVLARTFVAHLDVGLKYCCRLEILLARKAHKHWLQHRVVKMRSFACCELTQTLSMTLLFLLRTPWQQNSAFWNI